MSRRLDSRELRFKDIKGHENAVIIDAEPDNCPICDHGIEAIFIDAYGKADDTWGHYVQSMYRCPRVECQAIFTAYYTSAGGYRSSYGSSEYVFLRKTFIRPYFEEEKFDEEIAAVSSKFVDIYTQANRAESMGLVDICGAGYRRSLEFLIKDFLKLTLSEKTKEIDTHSLGYSIYNYVDSNKIKTTAGLAKDLGNDETHYIRQIEGLGLDDMKKLIRITTHWIVDELLTEKYQQLHMELLADKKKQ